MGDLVKFREYAPETAQKEKLALNEGGSDLLKLSPGKNRLRFMPGMGEVDSPFYITTQHFLKGPNGMGGLNCPRSMTKKGCAMCAQSARLKAAGGKAAYDMGMQMSPRSRIYAIVVNRADPATGPKIFPFGKMIHDALSGLLDDKDWGDFSHPVKGFDITIEKSGEGINTEYRVTPAKFVPLAASTEQMNDWLTLARETDMTRYLHVPNHSEITAKLADLGIDFADDDDDAPRIGAVAPRGALKGKSTRTVEDDLKDDDTPF